MEFKEWAMIIGFAALGAVFMIILDETDLEYYLLAIFVIAVFFGGWSKL